ncbi:probable prefoldin subunit 4 [Paramacrobiotus metropolitanus]|uniref:probable prefoldin subunit 4 n=1 Tax=Paramacrobiotus metropolitanus TaxID=2943436 RepID=UPI0024457C20|nr:probable prefoldin subunit 4 [Paramacrobiotus metropolitanus]
MSGIPKSITGELEGVTKRAEGIAISKDTHLQIARFSFVHTLYQEQTILANAAKKELQTINDAEDELILVDDEALVPCQVDAPSVFEKLKPEAEAFLADEKTRIQAELDEYESKAADYLKELNQLRIDLYGKLGNLIQLETTGTEDDD